MKSTATFNPPGCSGSLAKLQVVVKVEDDRNIPFLATSKVNLAYYKIRQKSG
jgi:hypothetical protein